MRNMLKISVFVFLVAILPLTALCDPGSVFVIHAIPDLPAPVDVYADGSYAFSFDYTETFGPADLEEGTYLIEIKLLGSTVLSKSITVEPWKNYTLIAHLTDTGVPGTPGIKLTFFENNIDDIANGLARLTVRHTANAPMVAVMLQRGNKGNPVAIFPGLANPDTSDPGQAGPADIKAGGYSASILYLGMSVYESGILVLKPGVSHIVYAIGDIYTGSFMLFIQTIKLEGYAPKQLNNNQAVPREK